MNNMNYLIECIKREIPPEVLELALCPPTMLGQVTYSLDYMIRSEILEGWILRDLNVLGGREVTIDISNAEFRTLETGYIVNVPHNMLGGREITSVMSIAYGQDAMWNMGGSELTNSFSPIVRSTDARVQLVGPNTIFIESNTTAHRMYLRCVLDNDSDFGNISARALPVLGDMAVQAAKAFIYTNKVVRVQKAAVIAGAEIDTISEIVNSYIDAIDLYKEMRNTKWRVVHFLQDRVSHNRYLRTIMPS